MAKEKHEHLYRGKSGEETEKEFEKRYGKGHGKEVYGAEVGIMYRKRHGGKNWNEGKGKKRKR
jgi:hypothetical protein